MKIKLTNKKPNKKQLDDLAREVIRLRDKVCRKCGSTSYLQVAHVISRSNHAIRWDLDNLFLLCAGCHTMRRDSAHHDPLGFAEWVKEQLGQEKYEALRMRANCQKIDKSAVKLYLEQELRRLK